MERILLSVILCATLLFADSLEEDLAGFDDVSVEAPQALDQSVESDMEGFEEEGTDTVGKSQKPLIMGLTGEVSQKVSYSWSNDTPHDEINTFNYFAVDVLLGYLIKLIIVERWIALEPHRGREIFQQLTAIDAERIYQINK